MRQFVCWIALSGISFVGLSAQKLETLSTDTRRVTRVETTMDYLTVIELGDPVTMVALGNQGAFTVERRENKVFVKPAEEGVRTNLFVWTTSGRFAYELVPAASIDETHFAIDQAPTPVAASVAPAGNERAEELPGLPAAMLTKASPILLAGDRETNGRVEVALRDLYRDRDRLYVRYALINRSSQVYLPTRPAAWCLSGVRTSQSLIPFSEHQLGERLTRTLKAADSLRLDVVEASQVAPIAAGGHRLGWLGASEPEANDSSITVLRLEFAADAKGTVEAMLVLPPDTSRREVADVRQAGR